MGTCRHPLVFLHGMLLLLLTVAHVSVAAGVKSVVLDAGQCGQTLYLGDIDHTYRVLMADAQSCPDLQSSLNDTSPHNDSFDCSVHFEVLDSVKSSQPCVDYARLRLKGNATTLSINRQMKTVTRLTWSRHPLAYDIMKTKRCLSLLRDRTLTLRFRSGCGHSLRQAFSSWIYVYLEPDNQPIFHVDGSCKHEIRVSPGSSSMVVRSYLWNDTVREPSVQDCTFLVRPEPYYMSNSFSDKTQICMEWNFHTKECGLAAYRHKSINLIIRGDLEVDRADNASCANNFSQTELGTCEELESIRPTMVAARRNRTLAQEVVDGAIFFEVNLKLKEIKRYTYGSDNSKPSDRVSDTYVPEYTDSEEELTDFNFGIDIYLKAFIPIAMLIGVCFCLCCVAHKKAKQAQPPLDPTPVSGFPGAGLRTQQPGAVSRSERVALNPLTRGGHAPSRSYQPHPPPSANPNTARLAGANRSALDYSAPPLSYEETMASAPSFPSPPPPPPPFSSLPAAPPAYDDLFPSRV